MPCDCDANNPNDDNWIPIANGGLLSYYKIQNQPAPITSYLPSFWSNSLVVIPTANNNPRLVWGPHPTFSTTNYKVYRAGSNTPVSDPSTLTYQLIYTSPNASTYSFTDAEIQVGNGDYFYYYITAIQVITPKPTIESSRSNYTTVRGGMYKKENGEEKQLDHNFSFSLNQNYPNPFNPSATISYQLATNSLVTLKVYDVLGNEIATLVNEEKAVGTYQVNFTAQQTTNNKHLQAECISTH